jgi:hypothetical protein
MKADRLYTQDMGAAAARQPALVASLPETVPVSAHAGDGQAQGGIDWRAARDSTLGCAAIVALIAACTGLTWLVLHDWWKTLAWIVFAGLAAWLWGVNYAEHKRINRRARDRDAAEGRDGLSGSGASAPASPARRDRPDGGPHD